MKFTLHQFFVFYITWRKCYYYLICMYVCNFLSGYLSFPRAKFVLTIILFKYFEIITTTWIFAMLFDHTVECTFMNALGVPLSLYSIPHVLHIKAIEIEGIMTILLKSIINCHKKLKKFCQPPGYSINWVIRISIDDLKIGFNP